ncbi:MAG TPA: hypothetical protein VLA12_13325 [Planctomycetaceae bacterium]|nr:hypothetical protein [Planctomycetaceae bacterium]
MIRIHQLAICAILTGAAFVFAGRPAPMMLKLTASVAQLEAAIARNVTALETLLAEEKNFSDNLTRDKISAKAASIAGLAQAILDHPDAESAKSLGNYVRESAKRLADSDSYANAKLRLGEVKLALSGKPLGYDALAEDDWYNVMTMEHMMEEMNQIQNDLRRTIRRSSDPEADSLDAVAAAVLAMACTENLDYTADEKDEAAWKEMSTQLVNEYRLLGEAMRKKETKTAQTHHANAAKLCTACHDKFRE